MKWREVIYNLLFSGLVVFAVYQGAPAGWAAAYGWIVGVGAGFTFACWLADRGRLTHD